MEQKTECVSNRQQLINHKNYYPKWENRNALIELFNPEFDEGTYYLTKNHQDVYCVFYQVRSPEYEINQQIWVESIQFLVYGRIEVLAYEEYRLLTKGEHSFSWGVYQEQQTHFHVNIHRRSDKRTFDTLTSFLASIPCTYDVPSDLMYKRVMEGYNTYIERHALDYEQISSSETKNHTIGRKKIILSGVTHGSLFDWMPSELGINIGRRLDWYTRAQAKSVSKQWFNFFQDSAFGAAGYYPNWGERLFYELFNPELKEGTFYFTRVNNEFRLYVQKRDPNLDYKKTLWVECQHFSLNKGAVMVTQLDELRLIYFDHDGCSYGFDSFKDYGCGADDIGIARHPVEIRYDSLDTYLQQFLPENAAPKNISLKRLEKGYSLRMPHYCDISSVSKQYEQYNSRDTETPKANGDI
ncbi:MAG: hypothetical protein Q8M40_11745 [Legionella sp.]|nr:hypothetical protein [Legionella sp.]